MRHTFTCDLCDDFLLQLRRYFLSGLRKVYGSVVGKLADSKHCYRLAYKKHCYRLAYSKHCYRLAELGTMGPGKTGSTGRFSYWQ